MKKIFLVLVFISCADFLFCSDLKLESRKVLFSIDSMPIQEINLCISYYSKDINSVPINSDGFTIDSKDYECYNSVIKALRTNSIDGLKPFIYELSGAKEKRMIGLVRILNNYWKNISSKTNPHITKIVYYGDSKAIFLRAPKPDGSGYFVLYIPVKTIEGRDFFIVEEGTTQAFLDLIAYSLMIEKNTECKSEDYLFTFPLLSGRYGVNMHFNGRKTSWDLKNSKDDSRLEAFVKNTYITLNRDFDLYPDFYSKYSSNKIQENIKRNDKIKNYLENSIKNYDKVIFIIDAFPIQILFYEYSAVNAFNVNFLLENNDNYCFVNFGMSDPVSDILNMFGNTLISNYSKQEKTDEKSK